ncbi:Deuterolysin metalloprotease family-domain-containing protein [Thelonectria olida]|uniref:Neutral protease 2 n=1 Tax=Thelonectria olida TaxID=1576542 RepID=A0A9P8WDX6_9HYPO|nr:Deuterolysin metalloprotease family-domain-containing protein [Thelonectria olida]
MKFSRVWTTLACLAAAVEAHLSKQHRERDAASLVVSIANSPSGKSTEIQATITNVGTVGLSALKLGTLLDDKPVKKLTVVDEDGAEVPFLGIELSLYYEGLEAEHFEYLSAGSSVTRTIDVASVYDLKKGTYTVSAEGTLPTLSTGSKTTKASDFKSKAISIVVEKASTAEVNQKLSRRTILQNDSCTDNQRAATFNGIKNCESLARAAAADAANPHSARFVEYFKSNETQARNHVSGRLLAVAEECSTTDAGQTRILCKDDVGYCEEGGPLIAYTTWVNGYVVMCPLFYDTLPPLPQKCHKQDHATTTIHEMTHARAVYEQEVSTNDYAYGYENSTALDALSCLYNADNYSLYANAVYLDC